VLVRIAVLIFCIAAHGQPQFFQFAVDQDAVSGAPDYSWLNQPLEAKDRLFVRDGHFFRVGPDLLPNTNDDQRVRLFGVNMAFRGNFPVVEDASRIAKRLRRLGINLVRFHHMDSSPDATPSSGRSVLLSTGPFPTFNPVAMERLRAFLAALRAEGIYANINLHVGYRFRPEQDNIPALPNNLAFPDQSKPLHILHPRLIELQRVFTRELLSALSLRDDPVLGMVEINNESSLLYSWQTGRLDPYLLGDYRTHAQLQWQEFLRERYQTTERLRESWGASQDPGPNLLPAGWWSLEVHSPSQARLERLSDDVARVTVDRGGAPVILKKVGFSVQAGESYVAEVEIRADLPPGQSRNVAWDVKQDISPWRQTTSRNVAVSSEWQRFTMPFTASLTMEGHARFGLSVENATAPVYVRNATLRWAGRRGLNEAETLEAGNVELVPVGEASNEARTNDYLLFLAQLDRAYLHAMLAEVRQTTDSLVPVTGTQMGFGGPMTIDSHAGLDYIDEHYYIDHPNFPNVAWDDRDWRIRDSSSVGSGLSTFFAVAARRVAGQPYTVSEFNQAWPNTYAAEADVTVAAFAAFQDWDGLMHFAYAHDANWDSGVPSGFDLNSDWTKWVTFGQAAWLFRSGVIESSREPKRIPMPLNDRLRATRQRRNGGIGQYFTDTARYQQTNAFRHGIQLDPNAGESSLPEELTQTPEFPLVSDTGQLRFERAPYVFVIQSEKASGVYGAIGAGKPVRAGWMDFELGEGGRTYAAVLATSLDDLPLNESRRILISNPGYILRTMAGTNPPSPQRIVPYPGTTDWFTVEPDQATRPSGSRSSGQKPVWMEHVPTVITWRTQAARIQVFPLDGKGERMGVLDSVDPVNGGFRLRLTQATPWYEIVAEY